MRSSSETFSGKIVARLAVAGLVSGALAGCSADVTRFSDASGGAGGYRAPQSDVTGSLGAPSGRIDSQPLPPPGGSQPVSYAAPGNVGGYQGAQGGGYSASGSYQGGGGYQSASAAPAPVATSAPRLAAGSHHVVVGGETLTSISRGYGVSVAQVAAANNMSQDAPLRIGQTLAIPAAGGGSVAQLRAPKPAPANATPVPAPAKVETQVAAATPVPPKTDAKASEIKSTEIKSAPVQVAEAKPSTKSEAPKGEAAKAPEKVETAAKVTPVDDADDAARTAGSGPQFRAPVRGRVISSFGPKPGGAHNDGVNFAVPEGTGVRAAEDGTVAYAGNELKGYGNLILIKHADGYVTAYAHNSELSVKRGDAVRRGQIIAKAGQSGGVGTPQLHFEIRKGSQPVDPSRYVAGL